MPRSATSGRSCLERPARTSGARTPKDKIDIFNLIVAAQERGGRETGAQRVARLRRVIALDPAIIDAWVRLGNEQVKPGDVPAGVASYGRALELNAESDLALINLALVAEARGDLAGAIRGYETEIDLHPASYKAAFDLARLYEQSRRGADQERAYRRAIEMNPAIAEGYIYLAKLYLDRGERCTEAVELARRGLALGPTAEFAPLGHYVLADLLNRLGRSDEAREALLKGRALEARAGRDRRGMGGEAGAGAESAAAPDARINRLCRDGELPRWLLVSKLCPSCSSRRSSPRFRRRAAWVTQRAVWRARWRAPDTASRS